MKVVTYEPDNSLKKGYLAIFKEIYSELKWNKWLTYQLFKRNFLGMYKQSFVGVFWAFLVPFISVGTFIILNRAGILNVGEIGVPYPIFALLGLAIWQIFSTGLVASANSLAAAGSMITKINFSKKSLVIATMGKPIITLILQLALVGILFAVYGILPHKEIFLVPLVLIPILLFTIGLGFILSLFNAFVKDVGNGLSVIITFLMLLTPVLYAKPRTGFLMHLTRINPMYYFISGARDLVLEGSMSEPKGFLYSTIVSITLFSVCLFVFHLTETKITERV